MKKVSIFGVLLMVLALSFSFSSNTGHASSNLVIDKEIPLYNEPSLITENGAFISSQTVKVIEARDDGWYKIETWLGDKWVAPNGVKIKLQKEAYIYNSDSLTDPYWNAAISPQTLTVLDQKANGWWKVETWLGVKWIAPDGVKVYLDKKQDLYNKASFTSKNGAAINPQTVTILEQRTDGWWKIKTWLGDKWIAPNGATLVLDKKYDLYNSTSFSDKAGAAITAQKVTSVDEATGGWIKIKTWLGDKWINLNGEEVKPESFKVPLVDSYAITSTYGYRNLNGSTSFHYGIDLARSGSTVKIVAAASGTVTRSYNSSSYGQTVMVQHNINGQVWETVYAHMRDGSRTVSVGDKVTQGQLLGYMGNTGYSFGQHLHFELHKGTWNASKSNSVDPQLYLDF